MRLAAGTLSCGRGSGAEGPPPVLRDDARSVAPGAGGPRAQPWHRRRRCRCGRWWRSTRRVRSRLREQMRKGLASGEGSERGGQRAEKGVQKGLCWRRTGREHGVVRPEAVDRPVLEAQGEHAHAGALLVHEEVKGEILDEELRKKGVENHISGTGLA